MSNFVPFLNVKSSYKQIQKRYYSIYQVLKWNYILGEKVSEFEEHRLILRGTPCNRVGNGLDALVALLAVI